MTLYKIKPRLNWMQTIKGNDRLWHADTIFGLFHVQQSLSGEVWWSIQYGPASDQNLRHIDEAKAAAESYYTTRLLEALEPVSESPTNEGEDSRND